MVDKVLNQNKEVYNWESIEAREQRQHFFGAIFLGLIPILNHCFLETFSSSLEEEFPFKSMQERKLVFLNSEENFYHKYRERERNEGIRLIKILLVAMTIMNFIVFNFFKNSLDPLPVYCLYGTSLAHTVFRTITLCLQSKN